MGFGGCGVPNWTVVFRMKLDPKVRIQTASLEERVRARLRTGATTSAIAQLENISPELAQLIIDDLTRRGLASPAESMCASGLGACGGGEGPNVALHCSGCPLVPLSTKPKRQ